ncbi:catalase [Catenulispora sp. MAP5-51]
MFQHYQQRVDGDTVRRRSPSLSDHSSQATLFWNSMPDRERRHIVEAFCFELGKVETPEVRERMVGNLAHVGSDLAARVATGLGMEPRSAGRAPFPQSWNLRRRERLKTDPMSHRLPAISGKAHGKFV